MTPEARPPAASRTGQRMVLRPMRHNDLTFATQAHRRYFPDNVMGRLGEAFLRRYYRTFLDAPHAVATIAEIEGRTCGYLVGILDTRQHRPHLRQHHGRALVATAILGVVLHPHLASRLIIRRVRVRLGRLFRTTPTGAVQPYRRRVAVLSHVAAVEEDRGFGVGSALVEHFLAASRVSGSDLASLATLDGPHGAGQFYVRQGWQLQSRRRTFDGRWISLYDLPLDQDG